MRVLRIADGAAAWAEVPNELAAIQAEVGGNIEALPLGPGVIALVNEDGIGLGLDPNLPATLFAAARRSASGYGAFLGDLHGPCLIVGADDEGEFTDVPASEDGPVAGLMRVLATP